MEELNSISIYKLQHGKYKINLSKYKNKIVFRNIFYRFGIKYDIIKDYIILDTSKIENVSKDLFKFCDYPEVSTKVLTYLGNLAAKYRNTKINVSQYDTIEMIDKLKTLGYDVRKNVTNQNYIILNDESYGVQVDKYIFNSYPAASVSPYNILTTKSEVVTKKDLREFLNGKIIKCSSEKAKSRMRGIIRKLHYKFIEHEDAINDNTFAFYDDKVEHDYPQLPIIAYETISYSYIKDVKLI